MVSHIVACQNYLSSAAEESVIQVCFFFGTSGA